MGCGRERVRGYPGTRRRLDKTKISIERNSVGGRAVCTGVDEEGYLLADVNYNEFGTSVVESGAYDNFSLGITKGNKPDHLAVLGYKPPHIESLSKPFEFSAEFEDYKGVKYIEFSEGGEEVDLVKILEIVKGLDITTVTESELVTLQDALYDKINLAYLVERLKSEGYTVEKEFSKEILGPILEGLGLQLVEPEPAQEFSREEIEAEVEAKMARKYEKKDLKTRVLATVPPSFKKIVEFAIDQAFEAENYDLMFEFSEGQEGSMRGHIEETFKTGGPFKALLQEFSKDIEVGTELKNDDSIMKEAYEKAKNMKI